MDESKSMLVSQAGDITTTPSTLQQSDAGGAASAPAPTPNTDHHENTDPTPASAAQAPRLNPRSCVTCRRRKVRCNKHDPCANCVKAGIECVFPGPGRAPRKSRKQPDAELLTRLRRLEGVVHNLGAHVDENGLVLSPPLAGSADIRARLASTGESPGSDRDESKRHSIDGRLGRLVIDEDRSRYVSNTFWTAMSDEVCSTFGPFHLQVILLWSKYYAGT